MAWRAGSVSDRRTCSEPVLRSLTLPARHEWRFRLAKAKSAEDAVALMLLIFLTVSLGIAAGYQVLWEWFHPDARRVRQRMAEEFGKELGPVSQSGLFKNLDQLTFDPAAVSASAEAAALLPVQAPRGLRGRLSDLLDKANAGLALEQFA